MKPIRLEMSAFGSYADTEVIEFNQAGSGLFLITGDTGSGKTTIFDAMIYALYDQTSGGHRDGNMMRSEYAKPTVDTYVKLRFLYGGEIYEIIRNPEYMREKKRRKADGTAELTTQTSAVTLILPDGSEFAGKKNETNKKIIEIIGLNAEQFAQVAMIAQGDFMRLLYANSDQRRDIFARIFNTGLYANVRNELNSRNKQVYGQLEDNRKLYENCLTQIVWELQPEVGAEPEEGQKDVLEKEVQEEAECSLKALQEVDAAKRLSELLTVQKERLELLEQKKQQLQQDMDALNGKYISAQNTNAQFQELEQACTRQKQFREQQGEIERKKEQLRRAKQAAKLAPVCRQMDTARRTAELSAAKLHELAVWMEENTPKLQDLQKQSEAAEAEQEQKAPQLLKELAAIEKAIEQLERFNCRELAWNRKISQEEKQLKQQELQKKQLTTNFAAAREAYQKAQEQYEYCEQMYLKEQAGVLASGLTEGEPCPVCGAVHHPNPAEFTAGAVSETEVNAARAEREKTEAARHSAMEQLVELSGQCETLRQQLAADQAARTEQLLQMQAECAYESQEQAATRQSQVQQQLEQLKTAENICRQQLTLLTSQIEGRRGQYKNEQDNLRLLQNTAGKLEQEFAEGLAATQFCNRQEFEAACVSEQDREKLEQYIRQFEEAQMRNTERIQLLKEQTAGKTPVDIGQMQAGITQSQTSKKALEQGCNELFSVVRSNEAVQVQLTKLTAERERLTKTFAIVNTLFRTADGSLTGTAKLDFETYALRRYFKQIVHEANKRLLNMTQRQWQLKCRDIAELGSKGSAGLDLDVYSRMTNSVRDIKTLSGGEAFMAALSMALGMADMIQNEAGAVQLDTMFIDEGFGSLDEASRQQAIQILNELAGGRRMVGIISHVTELKEQIDCKLLVHKGERGSHVCWSE